VCIAHDARGVRRLHDVVYDSNSTHKQVGPVHATFRALAPAIAAPRVRNVWPLASAAITTAVFYSIPQPPLVIP
jgi:hypothetical protein